MVPCCASTKAGRHATPCHQRSSLRKPNRFCRSAWAHESWRALANEMGKWQNGLFTLEPLASPLIAPWFQLDAGRSETQQCCQVHLEQMKQRTARATPKNQNMHGPGPSPASQCRSRDPDKQGYMPFVTPILCHDKKMTKNCHHFGSHSKESDARGLFGTCICPVCFPNRAAACSKIVGAQSLCSFCWSKTPRRFDDLLGSRT